MFRNELKEQIDKRFQEFIQYEIGNRLTPNNFNYLLLTIDSIFKENEIKKKIKGDKNAKN